MNRLKFLRKEKKLTLSELQDKININRSVISKMENGDQPINSEYLIILSSFFNVSSDYLLGISDIRTPHEPFGIPNHKVMDALGDEEQLIREFKRLMNSETNILLFNKIKTMTPQEAKKVLKIISAIEEEENEDK